MFFSAEIPTAIARAQMSAISLAIGSLLTVVALQEPAGPVCDEARNAGLECQELGHGLLISSSAPEAERIAGRLAEGERIFATHFKAPPAYVFVIQTAGEADSVVAGTGAKVIQSWFTDAALEAARREASLRTARARLASQGLTGSVLDHAANAAVAADRPPPDEPALDSGAVHEIGHKWLTAAYWPQALLEGEHGAGSAPDWLDEAAAMLVEGTSSKIQWRDRFTDGRPQPRVRQILEAKHPLKVLASVPPEQFAQMMMASPGGAAGITEATLAFYQESRALAAFLIEVSGRSDVLGDIAQSLARGESIESWAAAQPGEGPLGRDVDGWERAWAAWLRDRL